MPLPQLHLIAPAASCRPFIKAINATSAEDLIAIVGGAVGAGYQVSGDVKLIDSEEDEHAGGRGDDQERAADIQRALGDPDVVAVVALRGGAWFTRILPLIDFSVLAGRPKPVAVFGFSELTSLVNIVGASEGGLGIYDIAPSFLTYGLKRYAYAHPARDRGSDESPDEWMKSQLLPRFVDFFRDVVSMIEGRGSGRRISARLVGGELRDRQTATFVGGNLTVLSTLIGSAYQCCVAQPGSWLVLEDLNEKPERIDRMLAHLTLAHSWEECGGILLGNFHKGPRELTPSVVSLLRYHLPRHRQIPILVTEQVGHIWPMSPLPLHLPLTIERVDAGEFSIHWPATALRTV